MCRMLPSLTLYPPGCCLSAHGVPTERSRLKERFPPPHTGRESGARRQHQHPLTGLSTLRQKPAAFSCLRLLVAGRKQTTREYPLPPSHDQQGCRRRRETRKMSDIHGLQTDVRLDHSQHKPNPTCASQKKVKYQTLFFVNKNKTR